MKWILLFAMPLVWFACNAGKTADRSADAATETAHVATMNLKVGGMTCSGCEKAIEAGLTTLDGVVKVDATFTDSTAVVEADTAKVDVDKIKTTIAALGYTVIE
ncbi:MAG: cation transporter [Breznakibacter sp.]